MWGEEEGKGKMAGVGKGGEKGLRSGPPGSYATQQGSPWQLFSVCSMEPGGPEGQDGGSVVHSGMPGEPCGIVGPKTPITLEVLMALVQKSKFVNSAKFLTRPGEVDRRSCPYRA